MEKATLIDLLKSGLTTQIPFDKVIDLLSRKFNILVEVSELNSFQFFLDKIHFLFPSKYRIQEAKIYSSFRHFFPKILHLKLKQTGRNQLTTKVGLHDHSNFLSFHTTSFQGKKEECFSFSSSFVNQIPTHHSLLFTD